MADSARMRGWKWDGPNDQLEVWHDGVKLFHFTATATSAFALVPAVDDTLSLGTSTYQLDNLYVDGVAYIDGIGEDVALTSGISFIGGSSTGGAFNIKAVCATGNATMFTVAGATTAAGTVGFFGKSGAQCAVITNMTVSGTTKLNTLLAALKTYGLMATA